jgi:hypothetical protein
MRHESMSRKNGHIFLKVCRISSQEAISQKLDIIFKNYVTLSVENKTIYIPKSIPVEELAKNRHKLLKIMSYF